MSVPSQTARMLPGCLQFALERRETSVMAAFSLAVLLFAPVAAAAPSTASVRTISASAVLRDYSPLGEMGYFYPYPEKVFRRAGAGAGAAVPFELLQLGRGLVTAEMSSSRFRIVIET